VLHPAGLRHSITRLGRIDGDIPRQAQLLEYCRRFAVNELGAQLQRHSSAWLMPPLIWVISKESWALREMM
jgi:hypothetical protein